MSLLSSILSRDTCSTDLDGDNLEKDCFTFGHTQDSHTTHQLGVIRAAATILGCIVDAVEHSNGCESSRESTSQITGPPCSADQVEQHIEASQGFVDQLTQEVPCSQPSFSCALQMYIFMLSADVSVHGLLCLSCHTQDPAHLRHSSPLCSGE